MTTLNFEITINAPAQKVWQVLWSDLTYRQWTGIFQEGSYAVSDWQDGSKIQFLTARGNGMYGIITDCKPFRLMSFKHIGEVKNFTEQPEWSADNSFHDSVESYTLKEQDGITTLSAVTDATVQFEEYMNNTFPVAMAKVKELAETPYRIKVETRINAPLEKAWNCFTSTRDIMRWNHASDDWHTPAAENDLRAGGKFNYRMEAKDGSFGFNFSGIYDEIKIMDSLSYAMEDGRKVTVRFSQQSDHTWVTEIFEAESENSYDLQLGGWQAILNNFKKYVESI